MSFIEDSRHGESDIEPSFFNDETLPAGNIPRGWPALTCRHVFSRADLFIFSLAELSIGSTGKKQLRRASMRIKKALARSLKSPKREPKRAERMMPSNAPKGWLETAMKARLASVSGILFRSERNKIASGSISTCRRMLR